MTELRLLISNSTHTSEVLFIEPWGGEFQLEAGSTLRVMVRAAAVPVLELELRSEGHVLVVHDPPGATVAVYKNDLEIRGE